MILKKHVPLNFKNKKQRLFSALIGLALLPNVSYSAKSDNQDLLTKAPHVSAGLKIKGKAAFNYTFDDSGANKQIHSKKYGDWKANQFLLSVSGTKNDIYYKVERVWYAVNPKTTATTNSDYSHFLATYLGHKFSNNFSAQIGNTMVPFGLLNNLSWWKNIAFYAGFGDSYQPGVKLFYEHCPWALQVQVAKNNLIEPTRSLSMTPKITRLTGAVIALSAQNEDNLQANARLVGKHNFNQHTKVKLGLSAKIGNTYNWLNYKKSNYNAFAAHLNAYWHKLQAQLQVIPYNYFLKTGVNDNNKVSMAKDGVFYSIPSKAKIYSFGLAYKIPVHLGKINEVTVYDDYSMLSGKYAVKKTKMNIFGAKFVTGPAFVAADIIRGQNMYGIGEPSGVTFNMGDNNNTIKWKTKVNVNFGAQF